MAINSTIKIILIRLASIFYFSKKSKAIFYHDIHSNKKYTKMSTSADLLKEHIKIIRESGYEIVSEITKPNGQIEISFDDGFLGLFDNIHIINEFKIPIKLFIVISYLGKQNYINKEQLLALQNNTFMTIASHTESHKILHSIPENEIIDELTNSKKVLEDFINYKINSICFPEGKFSKKVVEIAESVGYTRQYCSIPGFYFDEFLPNVKKRSLVQFAKEKEFRAILKGGDHFLRSWYQKKHYTS